MLVVEFLDRNECGDVLIRLFCDKIDYRFPSRSPARFGNFMNLEPIAAALVRKDKDIVVCGRNEYMFDEIVFLRSSTRDASPTAALAPVSGNRKALDESPVTDRDDDVFLRDHVLHAELFRLVHNLGAAFVPVFLPDLEQLLLDHLHLQLLA